MRTLYTCACVQNHYKGLFVAITGQQVPVAQRFRTVACNAIIAQCSVLVACMFFLSTKLKYKTIARRSLASRAGGPV